LNSDKALPIEYMRDDGLSAIIPRGRKHLGSPSQVRRPAHRVNEPDEPWASLTANLVLKSNFQQKPSGGHSRISEGSLCDRVGNLKPKWESSHTIYAEAGNQEQHLKPGLWIE
jgi:hypothetical protein